MIFITSPAYVPRSHLCAMYGTSSPAQLGTPTTIFWNGRLESNQHIRESKSRALPFGYTRIKTDTREISRECLHAGNALARPLARRHPLPAVP